MLQNSNGPDGQPMTAVPEPIANVAEIMSTYRSPWALAGGWAVDAWPGRLTRDHGDVDLAVFDQPALFEHLAGWQLIGHDETKDNEGTDLWDGRALVPPAHLHGRPPERSGPLPERFDDSGMRVVFAEDGFWLDIQLGERSGRQWVLSGEPRVAMPLSRCVQQSEWGVPTTVPEVILFYKATAYVGTKYHLRPHDEADFVALLPHLSEGQREWLREAVSRVYDGEHPWVGQLAL